MKIVTRTPNKVVLEVEFDKLDKFGFDFIWDEIRDKFPAKEFKDFTVDKKTDSGVMFFEFISNAKDKIKSITGKKSIIKKTSSKLFKKEKEIKKG